MAQPDKCLPRRALAAVRRRLWKGQKRGVGGGESSQEFRGEKMVALAMEVAVEAM